MFKTIFTLNFEEIHTGFQELVHCPNYIKIPSETHK